MSENCAHLEDPDASMLSEEMEWMLVVCSGTVGSFSIYFVANYIMCLVMFWIYLYIYIHIVVRLIRVEIVIAKHSSLL